MDLQEQIRAAQEAAKVLSMEVLAVHSNVWLEPTRRGYSPTIYEKATATYLADCLRLARELESKLLAL